MNEEKCFHLVFFLFRIARPVCIPSFVVYYAFRQQSRDGSRFIGYDSAGSCNFDIGHFGDIYFHSNEDLPD